MSKIEEGMLEPLPEPEEEPLPKYGDIGRVLVEILGPGDTGVYRWEADVVDYDGSAFWINEGVGFDWWLDDIDFPGPGWWVVEGIYGEYHRGDGWEIEDDEDWFHGEIRPATAEEIELKELAARPAAAGEPQTPQGQSE
jgi:hypothetical protein